MKKVFICIVGVLLSLQTSAQKRDSAYSVALRVYPQYLFINGFRTDIEKCFHETVAIYSGVQYYTGTTNNSGGRNNQLPNPNQSGDDARDIDEIKGYGLNAGVKFYMPFLANEEGEGDELKYFTGVEINYNKVDVAFGDYDYYPFYQDGLQYYSYDIVPKAETISQRGASAFIGIQSSHRRLALEVIAGGSYRDSNVPPGLDKFRDYHQHFWDYGYSKFAPYFLISFGVYLF